MFHYLFLLLHLLYLDVAGDIVPLRFCIFDGVDNNVSSSMPVHHPNDKSHSVQSSKRYYVNPWPHRKLFLLATTAVASTRASTLASVDC